MIYNFKETLHCTDDVTHDVTNTLQRFFQIKVGMDWVSKLEQMHFAALHQLH